MNPHSPIGWAIVSVALVLPFALSSCSDSEPPNSCVAAGTEIGTPTGVIAVERLRIGDTVHSVNPITQKLESARLTAIRSALRPCLEMETTSGRTIRVTEEHPFLSPETGRYEPAARWLRGPRKLLFRHDTELGLTPEVVRRCETIDGTHRVYDLTVDSKHHNFLANGFVVHNKSEGREVDLDGRWSGTFTDYMTNETGTLVLQLERISAGKVAGTVEIESGNCSHQGPIEGENYGTFRGTVTDGDFVLQILAGVFDDEMDGTYRNTGPCFGTDGTLSLQRTSKPIDPFSSGMVMQLYELTENGIRPIGLAFEVR